MNYPIYVCFLLFSCMHVIGTTDDMSHYMNEDGTRFRMFGDKLDPWSEYDNPYWIINKNSIKDKNERFTGSFLF